MIVWSNNHLASTTDRKVSEFLSKLPEEFQQMGSELFTAVADEAYDDGYCVGVDEAEED